MTDRGAPLSLQDLITPLARDRFITGHFLAGRAYLSEPNPSVIDRVMEVDAFRDFKRFIRSRERVDLFGPKGFRSHVPGRTALDFYDRGDTLYVTQIERDLPAAAALYRAVAIDLGIHPRHLGIELFAARQCGLSSLHYDHDTNFQILIRGTKRWRLQRNRHIRNPLLPHHRLMQPLEEGFAERLPLPTSVNDLDEVEEVVATPGTCLFVPLGTWHEVEMSDECLAINVVMTPPRWIDAISTAVRRRLLSRPELRAPVFGALCEDTALLKDTLLEELGCRLEDYTATIRELTPEDIGLASDTTIMRWSPQCVPRHLAETPTGPQLACPNLSAEPLKIDERFVPLLRRLIELRGSFGLDALKALDTNASVGSLFQFMLEMKRKQYFEVS
jgi:hypothetical protein